MSNNNSLLDLPDDLLNELTRYLKVNDLKTLRGTNKLLKNIIDTLPSALPRIPTPPTFYKNPEEKNIKHWDNYVIKISYEKLGNPVLDYLTGHLSVQMFILNKNQIFTPNPKNFKLFFEAFVWFHIQTALINFSNLYYTNTAELTQREKAKLLNKTQDEDFKTQICSLIQQHLKSNFTENINILRSKSTLKINVLNQMNSEQLLGNQIIGLLDEKEAKYVEGFKIVINCFRIKNIEYYN